MNKASTESAERKKWRMGRGRDTVSIAGRNGARGLVDVFSHGKELVELHRV